MASRHMRPVQEEAQYPGASRVIRQCLPDMETPSSVAGEYVHRSKTWPMVNCPFAIPGGHRPVSSKVAISAIREASLRKKVVSSKTSGRLQCNSPLPDQLELFRLKTEAGLPIGVERLNERSQALRRAAIGPGCRRYFDQHAFAYRIGVCRRDVGRMCEFHSGGLSFMTCDHDVPLRYERFETRRGLSRIGGSAASRYIERLAIVAMTVPSMTFRNLDVGGRLLRSFAMSSRTGGIIEINSRSQALFTANDGLHAMQS
jgi:hypothetical protein